MIFFRETYHTKEFFIKDNDFIVRHVERVIDFRGKEQEKNIIKWLLVNSEKGKAIKEYNKTESIKLEKEYKKTKDE